MSRRPCRAPRRRLFDAPGTDPASRFFHGEVQVFSAGGTRLATAGRSGALTLFA